MTTRNDRRHRRCTVEFLEDRALLNAAPGLHPPAEVHVDAKSKPTKVTVNLSGTITGPIVSGALDATIQASGHGTRIGASMLMATFVETQTSAASRKKFTISDGIGQLTDSQGDDFTITFHGTDKFTGHKDVFSISGSVSDATGIYAGQSGKVTGSGSTASGGRVKLSLTMNLKP